MRSPLELADLALHDAFVHDSDVALAAGERKITIMLPLVLLTLSLARGLAHESAFVTPGVMPQGHCNCPSRTADARGSLFMNKGFGAAKKKPPRKKPSRRSGFAYTGELRPGTQSPTRPVPPEIGRPDYAVDGIPKGKSPMLPWIVEVKNEADIAAMRAAGKVAREVLDLAGQAVKVGATTDEIDRVCHEAAVERGAYPSPLNYQGFPKSCCTSINEIICHGIPDSTVLEDGMIVNVDVTVFYKGYHGDCSEMFLVGEVDQAGKDLVKDTYDIWQQAIAYCKPGRHYKGIGGVIENLCTAKGYTTVPNFCGHGIGKLFHTNPNILHYKNNESNGIMKEGHTFTIEPMICEGTAKSVMWPDKWTAATADGRRTAQFEHTFLMTADGAVPLTGKLDTSPRQFWEK
ncbi:methionine aminopeptidase [Ectocarpus siliculosus]|uniref:Methionine aminopeptidase n=1 Tax=Ectocarpus siliculosus TaxID=2880 RepID=D8LNA6_ECTSI|nr:methionine aminopeptidase [Ectocarpus siliculosus]|eukprot:CBN77263.1 methionine aminopeptidase [Ectocarpus siliculosus]